MKIVNLIISGIIMSKLFELFQVMEEMEKSVNSKTLPPGLANGIEKGSHKLREVDEAHDEKKSSGCGC